MKIGLLSDTHGSVPRTRTAAECLREQNVDVVLHCGDIGSEFVLIELVEILPPAGVEVHAVLGNVDLYDRSIASFPGSTGVSVEGTCYEMTVMKTRLAVIHGHDARELHTTLTSGDYDIIFTGHTHLFDDTRHGSTRLINPGAVYRATDPSVATLDLTTGKLKKIKLT